MQEHIFHGSRENDKETDPRGNQGEVMGSNHENDLDLPWLLKFIIDSYMRAR